MPTALLAMLFTDARAEEPIDLDPDAAEEPAPETPAAPPEPATPPTGNTPTIDGLAGTWWFTSMVDGKESVAWGCTGHPPSVEMDSQAIVITAGQEPLGGAVKGTEARGNDLVLKTTLSACAEPKEVRVRWADAGHHILEITRCEGTPRVVRAARDLASGVQVVRQCCDATGKNIRYVTTEGACPAGTQGQKPTPLRR